MNLVKYFDLNINFILCTSEIEITDLESIYSYTVAEQAIIIPLKFEISPDCGYTATISPVKSFVPSVSMEKNSITDLYEVTIYT